MEYLITPPEATAWKINENELIKSLEQSWPEIEIKNITQPDDYYGLEWIITIPKTGQRLDVSLHRDLQGISLDGDIKDCATFAVWFRSLVISSQELLFYDQGYNSHIELQENTTELEIVEPFLTLV